MYDRNRIPYRNGSGCPDPTAHAALEPIQRDQDEADRKAHLLLKVFKIISDLAGFDLINRIELKDRRTGRKYR